MSDIIVSSSSLGHSCSLSAVSLQKGKTLQLWTGVSLVYLIPQRTSVGGKLTSSASSSVDMDLIWPWGFEVPGLIHLPSCAIIPSNHINTGFKGSGQMLITYTGPRSACICVEGEKALSFFHWQRLRPLWKTLNVSKWNFHFPFWSCSVISLCLAPSTAQICQAWLVMCSSL